MSPLETTAVGLALAYIALAMRQSRLCWVAAIISAAIYIAIFTEVKLYMEAGLQLVYIAMAVWAGSSGAQMTATKHSR